MSQAAALGRVNVSMEFDGGDMRGWTASLLTNSGTTSTLASFSSKIGPSGIGLSQFDFEDSVLMGVPSASSIEKIFFVISDTIFPCVPDKPTA